MSRACVAVLAMASSTAAAAGDDAAALAAGALGHARRGECADAARLAAQSIQLRPTATAVLAGAICDRMEGRADVAWLATDQALILARRDGEPRAAIDAERAILRPPPPPRRRPPPPPPPPPTPEEVKRHARAEARRERAAESAAETDRWLHSRPGLLDLTPRLGVAVGVPLDDERGGLAGLAIGFEVSGPVAPHLRVTGELEGAALGMEEGLQLGAGIGALARWHPGGGPYGLGAGVQTGVWANRFERSLPLSGGGGFETISDRSYLEDTSPYLAPVLVPVHLELGPLRLELRAAIVCSLYVVGTRRARELGPDRYLVDGAFGPTTILVSTSVGLTFPLRTVDR